MTWVAACLTHSFACQRRASTQVAYPLMPFSGLPSTNLSCVNLLCLVIFLHVNVVLLLSNQSRHGRRGIFLPGNNALSLSNQSRQGVCAVLGSLRLCLLGPYDNRFCCSCGS